MKKLIMLAMVLGLLLNGCATATMKRVQNQWGPPARIETLENGYTVHYYYFNKGKSSSVTLGGQANITLGSREVMAGWWVVAITYDQKGKVVNKAQYWAQPNLNK